MKFNSDIDIDFADRRLILAKIKSTPASIITDAGSKEHNTGVYVTDVPVDSANQRCALDYRQAEQRGYIKLDFLNVGLYQQIRSEQHLVELMQREPDWAKLYDPDFCKNLIHIGNHYDVLIKQPEAVNSIERMAMFLAIIRPGKRHLQGRSWREVAASVWERPADNSYYFKKSHSIAYSHLVIVNMNLLDLTNQRNTTTL